MPIIRTPEERFRDLPGYPFPPRYVTIGGARMHYVDEGRGDPILCLHGEPSWSFLYRRMIPPLAARHRVIAPDFFGFGKSDKFTERAEYSFQMHRDSLVAFMEQLRLDRITLVGQDWGGLIGLRVAGEMPERFARLVIMNTALGTGEPPGSGFMAWREYMARTEDLDVAALFQRALVQERAKTPEILAAYAAPFPDRRYKEGVHAFPMLVPISPDDPGAAESRRAREVLARWTKPCLLMFSDKDPVLGLPAGRVFEKLIPSAGPMVVIRDAGHFLQEDKGEELAERIRAFLEANP
ncbi:MAG: alpha/beta fold hydrolase [Candidatus Rokubacteria bacterium]|nr:alpha/beta fold hydrolase [Candidatus Rokubacteria bacterium]